LDPSSLHTRGADEHPQECRTTPRVEPRLFAASPRHQPARQVARPSGQRTDGAQCRAAGGEAWPIGPVAHMAARQTRRAVESSTAGCAGSAGRAPRSPALTSVRPPSLVSAALGWHACAPGAARARVRYETRPGSCTSTSRSGTNRPRRPSITASPQPVGHRLGVVHGGVDDASAGLCRSPPMSRASRCGVLWPPWRGFAATASGPAAS